MLRSFGWNELDALGSLLGGTFAAAAFLVALTVLVREIGKNRADLSARNDERRDEERRQARLVYTTLYDVRKIKPPPEATADGDIIEPRTEVHVQVFNHSDGPIWDVAVAVPGRRLPLLIESVPPHEIRRSGWRDAPPEWYLEHVGAGCPGSPHWTSLDVTFVDNLGRRWRRSGRADPVRLLDSEDVRDRRS
jgi:hypothetical protein